jgi:Domain of unknown function (DUF5667)/Domain of unknown function (DUF5666)
MDTQLETKFIECLSALDQGEAIDQILARYPDDAAKLRPLLITAQSMPALRMEPSEAVKLKSREAFLGQAVALRQNKRRTIGFVPRLVTALAAVVMIMAVVSAGAVAASGSALPGDPLYGLKRTVENARLALSPDDSSRGALAAQFDQTRVDEVKILVDDKRAEAVNFSGSIESIQPNAWIVANVAVIVDSSTQITGTPLLSAHAHVTGETEDTGVLASEIEVDSSSAPQPAPPVDNTPTPASEDTPIPTPTPTVPRPSPAPSIEITPSSGVAPTPDSTEIDFSGVVQTIGAQSWTINGTVVQVTGSTQIDSGIAIGQNVSVKAVQLSGGQLVAIQISKIAEPNTGGGDSPHNGSTPTQEPTQPEATDKPQPTDSPEPTQQPEPAEIPHG